MQESLSEKKIWKLIKDKSILEIFAMNFDNVLSVFMILMQKGMTFYACRSFVEPDESYVKKGVYNYGNDLMIPIRMFDICAVGSVEKVLVAGLQIMYALGFDKGEITGEDYSLFSTHDEDGNFCEIHLQFKYNDRDCQLKIHQDLTNKTHIHSDLYVED